MDHATGPVASMLAPEVGVLDAELPFEDEPDDELPEDVPLDVEDPALEAGVDPLDAGVDALDAEAKPLGNTVVLPSVTASDSAAWQPPIASQISQPAAINSDAGSPNLDQISHPVSTMLNAARAIGGSRSFRAAKTPLAFSLRPSSTSQRSLTMVDTSLVTLQAVLMSSLLELQFAGATGAG